jgi:hypothetical protein
MYLHITSKVEGEGFHYDFGPFEFLEDRVERIECLKPSSEDETDLLEASVLLIGGRRMLLKRGSLDWDFLADRAAAVGTKDKFKVCVIQCYKDPDNDPADYVVVIDDTMIAYLTNESGKTLRKICL